MTAARRPHPRDATPASSRTGTSATVDSPGGHVYQSRAWAEHRARLGWQPRFLVLDDGYRRLALLRPWPFDRRRERVRAARAGRRPSEPRDGGDAPPSALDAMANWLVDAGVDVVATDAEIPAADAAYGDASATARASTRSRRSSRRATA